MPERKLPAKQGRFVEEYVIDFNAAAACVRAGYSKRGAQQQGSRLLLNVVIQAAIARRAREVTAAAGVEAERVVRELARLGFSDMRSVAEWDGDTGLRILDSSELSDDAASIIKTLTQTETVTRLRGDRRDEELVTRRLSITVHGKEHPLDTLAKYTGVLPVAGGNTLNQGGDHRTIEFHFDGGPDAAKRAQG